jgi:Fe-S-cluster containining protein
VNVACSICEGACCETIVLPLSVVFDQEWLAARGRRIPGTDAVELPARCPHLGWTGLCTIYETRPHSCSTYPVGGAGCRSAIDRRRSGDHRERILTALDQFGHG